MLKISQVTDVDSLEFSKAMEIYVDSFPSNERHPIEVIKRRVKQGKSLLFVGYFENKLLVIALLYPLKHDFVLLDYIAVVEEHRSRGFGTEFVKKLLRIINDKQIGKHLLVEVEDPRFGNNKLQRERRLKFYKRLGAKQIARVKYMLPPLDGTSWTKMILLVLCSCDSLNSNIVRELIIQLYTKLYNTEEKLDEVLSSVPDEIHLV